MKYQTLPIAMLLVGLSSGNLHAKEDGIIVDAWLSAGQDVVPPDIIENGIDQDRIEAVIETGLRIGYQTDNLLVDIGTDIEIYPVDSRFNRYGFGPRLRGDIPLSAKGKTKLRLGVEYQFVLGEEGRVFDRPRVDAQLIHRHNKEHATTARLRYGFRNQSEDRFTGFDQSEWLAELRHNWRPNGGPTAINFSLLGLRHEADDDRFSYTGYGFRTIARTPLTGGITGVGRISLVQRDYDAPFSPAFPIDRSDTHFRAAVGLEKQISNSFVLFGDAGYVSNSSNIPVRDYDGFVGRIGIRYSLDRN